MVKHRSAPAKALEKPEHRHRVIPDKRAALAEREAVALVREVVEQHWYSPSSLHMGDCSICGHLQQDEIHFSRSHPPAYWLGYRHGQQHAREDTLERIEFLIKKERLQP